MNRLAAGSMLWLLTTSTAAVQELNYRLTVIEEEVPLADGSRMGSNRFFPITMAAMIVLFLGTLISLYYFRCRRYQQRIVELGGERKVSYSVWNLKRLKETTAEMEWQLAGEERDEDI